MNGDKVLGAGKWLKLVEREFHDKNGQAHTWEFATRPNDTRTVCLIAIKREDAPSLVLVKQYPDLRCILSINAIFPAFPSMPRLR